jgi:hypothetical protein
MEYGEIIDSSYDPNKNRIYPLFSDYFDNPLMNKIKEASSQTGEYSVYICKVHALLIVEFKYIICFVLKDDNPIGTAVRLSELRWVSLQTRTLKEEHNIPYHSYIPRQTKLNNKIALQNKFPTKYVYTCTDLPIIVTLLPNAKTEYGNSGSVNIALNTYNTIINFLE